MTWLGPSWDHAEGQPGLALTLGKTEVKRMKAPGWLAWVLKWRLTSESRLDGYHGQGWRWTVRS